MKQSLICSIFLAFFIGAAGLGFAGEKEITRAATIKQAQEGLAALGFYEGAADGKMNRKTRAAIKHFRKKEMEMEIPSGMLNKRICTAIAEKADEKKLKDAEAEKSGVDTAKEKIRDKTTKVRENADLAK